MRAEAVIYTLLSGAAAVTAIVGARIYPVVIPQGEPMPAIAYELISSAPTGALDAAAPTHTTRTRVRVNLLGEAFDTLRTLYEALVPAVRHQRGEIAGTTVHAIFLDHEGPVVFDEALQLFTRPLDFLVLHQQ